MVAFTGLSGKELRRQIGVGRVVTSGSLGGVMVNTLVRNARDGGSIPALGTQFPISITRNVFLCLFFHSVVQL